jgi:NAD(P)-dependent dehydrogenase (short-subunit alcohol dehydrogenase family)
LAFSAAGAKVVVADVLDGSPVAERISETQRPAIYMRADVTSKQSVEKLVADTVREFGTVDILVNYAALFADLALKPFQQISEEEWDRVMLVNVRGTFQCANPYISHYLCMIGQICDETCLLFCRRGAPWRLETRECLNDYLTTKVAKRSRWAWG